MDNKEKVLIVSVLLDEMNIDEYELSIKELEQLVEACNMQLVGKTMQKLVCPNKSVYVGPGKLEEVKELCLELNAQIVIFDNTLSPTQIRNIQQFLDCPVMDRTGLILEIFETRAKTREARLQVEAAKLQYMLPRLVGLHEALSRQGGGGGSRANKGAGEKKLELDKRKLEHRLSELRNELKEIKQERIVQRSKRNDSGCIRAALVGYTNAGKSTLMNAMISKYYAEDISTDNKRVFEKDMLFATLDTTVRRIEPKKHQPFLLSDTVGFISNLPHNLIEAFHSTLEEAVESDILLHLVDYSDLNHQEQIKVTLDTLKDLGAGDIPTIYIYNKADLCIDENRLPIVRDNRIYLSAKKLIGLDELLDLIDETLSSMYSEGEFIIPYNKGRIVSFMNENGVVKETDYRENGIYIRASMRKRDFNKYSNYLIIDK